MIKHELFYISEKLEKPGHRYLAAILSICFAASFLLFLMIILEHHNLIASQNDLLLAEIKRIIENPINFFRQESKAVSFFWILLTPITIISLGKIKYKTAFYCVCPLIFILFCTTLYSLFLTHSFIDRSSRLNFSSLLRSAGLLFTLGIIFAYTFRSYSRIEKNVIE